MAGRAKEAIVPRVRSLIKQLTNFEVRIHNLFILLKIPVIGVITNSWSHQIPFAAGILSSDSQYRQKCRIISFIDY